MLAVLLLNVLKMKKLLGVIQKNKTYIQSHIENLCHEARRKLCALACVAPRRSDKRTLMNAFLY